MKNQTRNKLILLALFGLFFVPVLLAYLMNAGYIHYRPQPSRNHGELITPPIKMSEYTDQAALAQADDFWKLVYVTPAECQADCQRMLDTLYRVFLATGRHRSKVRLIAVSPMKMVDVPAPYSEVFQFLSLNDKPRLKKLFEELSVRSLGQGTGFYIVAPEGFLMMSYARGFDPSGTIKDLNVLLKRKDG